MEQQPKTMTASEHQQLINDTQDVSQRGFAFLFQWGLEYIKANPDLKNQLMEDVNYIDGLISQCRQFFQVDDSFVSDFLTAFKLQFEI